jgi:hypothetical protein
VPLGQLLSEKGILPSDIILGFTTEIEIGEQVLAEN